ncbi:hypothetical protein [Chryseobacterium sp. GP-SGM7]|uniref:hypothetical protein n=1 Tax=Chryseobacterium sp. GP-SGM7 TaxID=3411323 RepID=UPI003B94BAD4
MNHKVLQKYGLTMAKSPKKFHGIIYGNPIANYIYNYRHPDDVADYIADLDLAISGNFSKIEDPDHGGGMGNYWFAQITPTHFELWQEGHEKIIIPLEDWKEILLAWKECLE